MEQTINDLMGDRAKGVLSFYKDHIELIEIAAGSSFNHQAWPGGYKDHIIQCMFLCKNLYASLNVIHPLCFSLESAAFVLFFHDVEKIWKHSIGLPDGFNKVLYITKILPVKYNIGMSREEIRAMNLIHGEGRSYRKNRRAMNELGAFCHSIDVISARIFHSVKKLGVV